MRVFFLFFVAIPLAVFNPDYPDEIGQDCLSIVNFPDRSPSILYDSIPRVENAIIPGDLADPSLIRVGNTYYATGTSSEWAPHFPLFQSNDLVHWKQTGYVFSQTPSWAASSFWAPELFYRNGIFYVYYVAKRKSDAVSCIAVATTDNPEKGFTDHGVMLEFGKEAIDAFIIEDNGALYITWKAYGLDNRPIEILGSRLSDDGMKLVGKTFSLLRDEEKIGLEGQCIIKRGNYFYLFYSPGNCCGRDCSYKIEVARSSSIEGPYEKYAGNPLLFETNEWKCTGHGTMVTTIDGKDFYLYHAYNKADNVYTGRQAMLGEVDWGTQTGWPAIKQLDDKTLFEKKFRDEFSSKKLSFNWQWDYRNSKPSTMVGQGGLTLSGQAPSTNLTGTVLAVRPVSGNYEMTTEVTKHNSSFKGLVIYGDAGQSISIGIKNDLLQVCEVKDNKRTILREQKSGINKNVWLKMNVENGYQVKFYWSTDNNFWNELTTGGTYYDGSFLPQWDRSPRPGLVHNGIATIPASFRFFDIRYK